MNNLIAQVPQLAITMRHPLQSKEYPSSPVSLSQLKLQLASEYIITEHHTQRRVNKRMTLQRQRQRQR